MGRIENDASSDSIAECVFVAAVTFLANSCQQRYVTFKPSRCLAKTGGSDAMIYILSFTKRFSHSKVDGGGGTQHGDRSSLLSLFQNKRSKLKT
jgi:hypothetical protein